MAGVEEEVARADAGAAARGPLFVGQVARVRRRGAAWHVDVAHGSVTAGGRDIAIARAAVVLWMAGEGPGA